MKEVQWRVLLLLMMFSFVGYINRVGMSVAGAEKLMKEYNISEPQMGAVYSSFLLVYTLLMIPGGWLIEKVGPRWALGWMGIGTAVLATLTGLPGWGLFPAMAAFPLLLVVRGALGAVTVPMYPGSARAISLWIPPNSRAWGNGMVTSAALLGNAATYSLFGPLMDWLTWPGAFLVLGLATAVLTSVWLLTTTDGPSIPAAKPIAAGPDNGGPPIGMSASPAEPRFQGILGLISQLRDRNLALLSISYGAYSYFQYLFFYWVEHYFLEILELSKELSRFNSMVVSLAMALGMIVGGFLSDRLQAMWEVRRGRAVVAICGMIACTIFAVVGVHTKNPNLVVTFFALAMGTLGMCEGPFWTTAVDLGGRRGGLAAAILNTGGNFVGALAPLATPVFAKYFSWQAGIELACGICALGAVLWLWIRPEAK